MRKLLLVIGHCTVFLDSIALFCKQMQLKKYCELATKYNFEGNKMYYGQYFFCQVITSLLILQEFSKIKRKKTFLGIK